jgi:hypothetical protein
MSPKSDDKDDDRHWRCKRCRRGTYRIEESSWGSGSVLRCDSCGWVDQDTYFGD